MVLAWGKLATGEEEQLQPSTKKRFVILFHYNRLPSTGHIKGLREGRKQEEQMKRWDDQWLVRETDKRKNNHLPQ